MESELYSACHIECVCVLSCFVRVRLCDPMDCSPPGSSVYGILHQEYWSGSPCPPPGDLPDPGIEPVSPASPALAGGFFTAEPPGRKPLSHSRGCNRHPHHLHSFKAHQHMLLHHWNRKTRFSAAINSGQVSYYLRVTCAHLWNEELVLDLPKDSSEI